MATCCSNGWFTIFHEETGDLSLHLTTVLSRILPRAHVVGGHGRMPKSWGCANTPRTSGSYATGMVYRNGRSGKLSHSNDACICSNDVNVCNSAHCGVHGQWQCCYIWQLFEYL